MPTKPPREPPRLPAWARRDEGGVSRPLFGPAADATPTRTPAAPPTAPEATPNAAQEAAQPPPQEAPPAPPAPAPQPGPEAGPPPPACPRCEATRQQADAQVAVYAQGLSQAVGNLARTSVELGMRLNLDAVTLARKLAERIIQRAVVLDERLVLGNLRRAMEVAGPVERLTLRCAERDVALLRAEASAAASQSAGHPVEVVVQASPDLEPGSLFLLFEEGLVDARLGTQLDRLTAAVEDAVSLAARGKGARDDAPADPPATAPLPPSTGAPNEDEGAAP